MKKKTRTFWTRPNLVDSKKIQLARWMGLLKTTTVRMMCDIKKDYESKKEV
jgi:hypothetical protein